jgi:hypothetical protein
MQRSGDRVAHESNEECAKGKAGQEIAADRAENGADDNSWGNPPE